MPTQSFDDSCISSFVIRIYSRKDGEDEPAYRIKVTHVQSQEETSLSTLEEATDVMKQHLKNT